MTKKESIFIAGIVCIAFLLRVLWLNTNLFYGYEQGRDLLVVRNIANFKDLTLLGPKTDVDGVFHGAFSYYLLVPFFILGQGSPFLITYLLILIHSISILFLYLTLCKLVNKKVAYFSTLFYSFSYASIIYSRWLSNPNLIPVFSIFLFYFLVKSREKLYHLSFAAFCWAIIFHLSLVSAATLVLPIIAFLIIYRISLSLRVVTLTIIALTLGFSPYLIFELKHHFFLSHNLLLFLGKSNSTKDYKSALDQFLNELTDNLIIGHRVLTMIVSLFLSIVTIIKFKNNRELKIIVFFLLGPVIFFTILGVNPLRHTYITVPLFLSILLGFLLSYLPQKIQALILLFFIAINLSSVFGRLKNNTDNFLQRSQRTYIADELNLVDYVYKNAEGKPFSYDYFTIPYWKEEGWDYLFSWYGQNKYGYQPSKERTTNFYVLIEPSERQVKYQSDWYENLNQKSSLLETFTSGKMIAEKRMEKACVPPPILYQ